MEKPRKIAEAEENPKKAELNFMVDVKTLIHKTSVDPKLLHLKICLRNNRKERAPENFSPVLSKVIERLGLFTGDKIVIPEELKKQVVEALHFGHPGSTKMLAESNIF